MIKTNKIFIYAGYPIPASYILKLKYKHKYTAYTIDRLIFRAVQYATWLKSHGFGPKLIEIMQAGLQKNDNPVRSQWLLRPSFAEEGDSRFVQEWIDEFIYKKPPPSRPEQIIMKYKMSKLPEAITEILKKLIKE